MCFQLYAATTYPLSRKPWDKHAPGLSITSLTERDDPITVLFSRPEVQCIGSTSGCGCDFPHVTLTRGEWVGYAELVVDDPEWEATERVNREALVALLQQSGEKTIELYGIWEGNRAARRTSGKKSRSQKSSIPTSASKSEGSTQ